MKRCNYCGTETEDNAVFCPVCGAKDKFTPVVNAQATQQTYAQPTYTQTEYAQPTYTPQTYDQQTYTPPVYTPPAEAVYDPNTDVNGKHGIVVLGIIGAILFSLLGAVLYFLIYQAGLIVGIGGLVIYWLAGFGYRLFARTKNKKSAVAITVSVILMLVMIFVAEFFSLSYILYNEMNSIEGAEITFTEAVELMPEAMEDPKISSGVAEDLAFAYIFGIVLVIVDIADKRGTKKKKVKAKK